MAKNRGWWTLTFNNLGLGDDSKLGVIDNDREHIAEQIKKGFTAGEIVEDEE